MSKLSINRATLADQVFDRVADAIVRGHLLPTSPVNEVELAAELGVSRAPLREALFKLEAKGLVQRIPHVGTRVTELGPNDLRQLFQIRESLEGMAARLAAVAMSPDDLEALEASLMRHKDQPDVAAGAGYYQAEGDQDLHFRIVRGSGNERLIKLLCDDLYHLLRIYRFRGSATPGRAKQAFKEHVTIVKALRRRDPDAAEDAMRAHIRKSWANVQTRLKCDAIEPSRATR